MAGRKKVKAIEIRVMKLAELIPASYNPRDISPKAFAGLKKSIEKYGDQGLLVWNRRSKTLVSGHQRVKAMQELDWTEARVSVVDLSEEDEKALNITLNNPHIAGEFTDGLAPLLEELKLELPEFEELKLDELLLEFPSEPKTGLTDPDDVPENVEPKTKTGDIWILGQYIECPKCGRRHDL